MSYARIDLQKTNYQKLNNFKFLNTPPIGDIQSIYQKYCRYKKFKSVMPIFDSELLDKKNDVIGYYENNKLIAFSLLRRYDNENVEAVQFAWNYDNPRLALGICSLKNECAIDRKSVV